MLPGSTLRYGSSFWSETERPRLLRILPIEAAVIPLPSEDTTPPVTKTYFDNADPPAVFPILRLVRRFLPPRGSLQPSDLRIQDHHASLTLPRAGLHRQLRLRLRLGHPHLLEEALHGRQLGLHGRQREVHGDHDPGLHLPHDLGGARGFQRLAAPPPHQEDGPLSAPP